MSRHLPYHIDSLVPGHTTQQLHEFAIDAFRAARYCDSENGMETHFSRWLVAFITQQGDASILAIARIILGPNALPSVCGEALRWLGRIDHPQTHIARRTLLEHSLTSPSSVIRDGAILGLASLNDSHATIYLHQAILKEQNTELKYDMRQVYYQLINSGDA